VGAHYDDSHAVITFTIEHNTRHFNAGVYFLILDVTPINIMYQEEVLSVAVVKKLTKKSSNHHSNHGNADLVCYVLGRNTNLRTPSLDRLS
jgi:hypothetical protein